MLDQHLANSQPLRTCKLSVKCWRLSILEFLQWNTLPLVGEVSDILWRSARSAPLLLHTPKLRGLHQPNSSKSWESPIQSFAFPRLGQASRSNGNAQAIASQAHLTVFSPEWLHNTTSEVWFTGWKVSMDEKHKRTSNFVITMSFVLGNAPFPPPVLQWQFLKGSICLILSNLLVLSKAVAAYSLKHEHKQWAHGRPNAGWPIATSPNMVKKMFDWSPKQSAKFNNSAACRVPQNPLLRLTGTSACSHGLDHNCTCAQWQRPEPFVVPALPGKAQARCPTRLSGTAAHWSASLLGLNILRKSWVSQGYKRTCTRHSGLV